MRFEGYRFLLTILTAVGFYFITLCHARYFQHSSSRGREARLVSRGGGGGGYGGNSGDYGQVDSYDGGSTGGGYSPQQIPTQGGVVAGQGAYYGSSGPFVNYRHSHIDIPVPQIEIPRFNLPILPDGPPPLFLPTIDIPSIPYPNIELPRIPPIHPPQVNFPGIPPIEGFDIPTPWVRFVKEDWPKGGNIGGPYNGGSGGGGGGGYGNGGGGLYKRTGRNVKTSVNNTYNNRLGARGEPETREVQFEMPVKQVEITIGKEERRS